MEDYGDVLIILTGDGKRGEALHSMQLPYN